MSSFSTIPETADLLKVLKVISDNPRIIYCDIVEKSGLTRYWVSQVCNELEKSSLIAIKDCSEYTITRRGKSILIAFDQIKKVTKHRYGYWVK